MNTKRKIEEFIKKYPETVVAQEWKQLRNAKERDYWDTYNYLTFTKVIGSNEEYLVRKSFTEEQYA